MAAGVPRCHFLFLRLILFGKLWNYIIEDMRTETIALINEGSLGLDFKPVMTRVLKGVLVAASVWITASVVSKEEAMNPGTGESFGLETARESVGRYPGVGSEVTEEAHSILKLMENRIVLAKAVLEEKENTALNETENPGRKLSIEMAAPAVISEGASGVKEVITVPAADKESSDTAGGEYALTFDGSLPMDYCLGSTVELSDITLMYRGGKIMPEDAVVKIPDTGKAGNYKISVEYKGCKAEIPFGVVDYKVHLNGNGGSCTTDMAYLTDYMLEETAVPVRPGKEFVGWYRDEACTIPFERAKRGETELELYAGWKEYTGFLCDDAGYITSYTGEGNGITDGLLVLPDREGCVGIRAGSLDGFAEEIFEIYVPAGITDIEPGTLENLPLLFYIEVDSDNPVYESREGLLYSRTDGSLILRPAGR